MKGRVMRRVFCWISACVCLSVCARRAAAEELSKLSEADSKQVNGLMDQRAQIVIETRKLESEVSSAWTDTAYASPEVDALRARYRELQHELLQTQREIQKKVQDVPAVQEKLRRIEELKKKGQELTKKVSEKVGG